MLAHDLSHFYVRLLEGFRKELNEAHLTHKFPGLRWKAYLEKEEFTQFEKEVEKELVKAQQKVSSISSLADSYIGDIGKSNKDFEAFYRESIYQTSPEDAFWKSFRRSVSAVFRVLMGARRQVSSRSQTIALTVLMLSYGFETLKDPKTIRQVFQGFRDSS